MAEQNQISADTIAQAFVKAFRESQQPEQTDFELLNKSVFNPTGKPRPEYLKYESVYQNNIKINPDFLTNEEISLFNKIKPGRYNDRKWEVVVRDEGEKTLELRYSNKSQEDRFDLIQKAPTLVAMLNSCCVAAFKTPSLLFVFCK